MPTLGWTESAPSGTSLAGNAPAQLHSVWTALSLGLATDLFWDGSGGASAASRGDLRPGASRTYFAPQSASSNSNTATQLARAFFASDTSRLLAYDSTGTFLVGTPAYIEYRATPILATREPFLALSGVTTVSTVTTGATSGVTVLSVPPQSLTHATPLAAFATCSERSVLVRPVLNFGLATSLVLEYRGTTNASSTATFSWQLIVRPTTGEL